MLPLKALGRILPCLSSFWEWLVILGTAWFVAAGSNLCFYLDVAFLSLSPSISLPHPNNGDNVADVSQELLLEDFPTTSMWPQC